MAEERSPAATLGGTRNATEILQHSLFLDEASRDFAAIAFHIFLATDLFTKKHALGVVRQGRGSIIWEIRVVIHQTSHQRRGSCLRFHRAVTRMTGHAGEDEPPEHQIYWRNEGLSVTLTLPLRPSRRSPC